MRVEQQLRIRMGTFDALKGILIIFTILYHLLSHYTLGEGVLPSALMILVHFFGAGAMPAFYMIAGMFFKPKSILQTMQKTANGLMKPYVITGVAVAVLFPVVYYFRTNWIPSVIDETPRWILAYILGISTRDTFVFGYRVYECYVAWFLPTMFIALNLLNLVLEIKNILFRHIVVTACTVIGLLLGKAGVVYFFGAQGLLALGFCYLGYQGKHSGFFERARHPWWIWTGLLLMYIYQFNQVPFSIAYINNTNGFLFATFDAVLLLLLTIRASNTEFEQPAWLVKVGVFSPWILCVHAVELTIFPWEKLLEIFPYSPNLTFLIEVLLKIIIIVPCCIVIKIIVQYRFRKLRRNRGK